MLITWPKRHFPFNSETAVGWFFPLRSASG